MERLKFDSNGRLAAIDGKIVDFEEDENEEYFGKLKTSKDIQFLNVEETPHLDWKEENEHWNLFSEDKRLEPLKFSNGKTQQDVVRETVNLIKQGNNIIFIHGACGTGKSAIALNIARVLGRASIVVPVKGLQRQYEEDYTKKKYLIKKNGKKMKIAVITGRDNHDSIFEPGVSCADPNLPDTIKINDKNYEKIKDYYEMNPYLKTKQMPDIKKMRRIAIAPANPYWSPILSATIELQTLKDADKIIYLGLQGKEFIFYHRKKGCSYYDQYLAYRDADAIIYNAAKYKIEVALDRKPFTEVDIIDEADEFLDNFMTREQLNLTRLYSAFQGMRMDEGESQAVIDTIMELIRLEEKNKQAIGIDEEKLYHIKDTQIEDLFKNLIKNKEVVAEIELDDSSYANKALEAAWEL
jgi:energy-coupling factor transporter ATP-binding protein EcfA2